VEDERVANGVDLAVDLKTDGVRVSGHADGLVQTLMNLLKNAIDAAVRGANGAPPRVALSLARADGNVLISVADNGEGLTPDEAARVFEPFYSTKKAQGGTGLGLAIASDIIRAHGGTLTVESAKGRGSRFTVSLPAL
jgi:signal transduction histidine kinase